MFRSLVLIVGLVLLASPALAGYKECEYHANGTFVRSKLSGLKGMVVTHRRLDKDKPVAKNCQFDVRFVTSTGWVYTIEQMMPYELTTFVGKKEEPKPVFVPEGQLFPFVNQVENLDFGS